MGPDGLRRATEVAILNANYVAARLAAAYPVLYTGDHDRVAHECILDLRPITTVSGVTVDDVAKRLIDFGFHAPTMSFPVAGTLMVEPTESESLAELDRFVDAMLAIREEIAQIERGEVAHDASALAHAPHTAEDLLVDDLGSLVHARAGGLPRGRPPPTTSTGRRSAASTAATATATSSAPAPRWRTTRTEAAALSRPESSTSCEGPKGKGRDGGAARWSASSTPCRSRSAAGRRAQLATLRAL